MGHSPRSRYLGETGPLSQGVQARRKALRIHHIKGMEVRKKRPRGFKKEAQEVQVSPLNPLFVAPCPVHEARLLHGGRRRERPQQRRQVRMGRPRREHGKVPGHELEAELLQELVHPVHRAALRALAAGDREAAVRQRSDPKALQA